MQNQELPESSIAFDGKLISKLYENYNVIDNRDGSLGSKVTGTNNDDLILASDAGDSIRGLDGNDCIIGGDGADLLVGNAGDDQIYGGAEKDTRYGKDGDDIIFGDMGNDILKGGDGNDTISGGIGKDKIFGGEADAVDGNSDTLNNELFTDKCYIDDDAPAVLCEIIV